MKTYAASACLAGFMFSCFLWYLIATAKAGRVDGTEVIVRDTFDQVRPFHPATCHIKEQRRIPSYVNKINCRKLITVDHPKYSLESLLLTNEIFWFLFSSQPFNVQCSCVHDHEIAMPYPFPSMANDSIELPPLSHTPPVSCSEYYDAPITSQKGEAQGIWILVVDQSYDFCS